MDSSGSIHEFADSQFGHLFANGANREQARRNMVLALKELSIRGDISTTVDFISRLIELEDFVANKIDTAWLDGIIKENVEGMGAAEGLVNRPTDVKISTLSDHIYIVLGATIRVYDTCSAGEKRFVELLDKGQLPPRSLLKMSHDVELILNGMKYRLKCTRNGPKSFSIAAIGGDGGNEISTNVRVLSDGGYLIDVGGTSFVAYVTSKGDAATGMKINVSGKTVVFSPDYDPTALRTDVAGKLVKKLKQDGARVKKGEPYCEIEVMKVSNLPYTLGTMLIIGLRIRCSCHSKWKNLENCLGRQTKVPQSAQEICLRPLNWTILKTCRWSSHSKETCPFQVLLRVLLALKQDLTYYSDSQSIHSLKPCLGMY